jgi:four helix bundle protein
MSEIPRSGSLEELITWQRAMDLVDAVYRTSRQWPADERFGLTNQVRRAAVSVASNIAEGHGRRQDGDFLRFLAISHGSLMEVKTQLIIAERQAFSSSDDLRPVRELVEEVARLIHGLRRATSRRHTSKSSKDSKS